MATISNRYKVPQRAWRKFGPDGQRLFNALYATLKDQSAFRHWKDDCMPRKSWDVLRWNVAFVAASEIIHK